MSNTTLFTEVHLPAYTAENTALLVTLKLKATPHQKLTIKAQGNIAIALKRSLRRVIEIMSSINPCWHSLLKQTYQLESKETPWLVKDARSAGLPLAIGLLQLNKNINHQPPIHTLIGSGILRIDGSIEPTHKEDIKKNVIKNMSNVTWITSNMCQHLFELEYLMDQHQSQPGDN
ncbi:MAG: hypothetical protein P1U61_02300 [Legionellaceae bacterium]|nr:hypothetical protein [Legionellaceae bacterium]